MPEVGYKHEHDLRLYISLHTAMDMGRKYSRCALEGLAL